MKRQRGTSDREKVLTALKDGVKALSISGSTSSTDLVCRDEHVKAIVDFLSEPVHHTMQVFGMPGTGKTATVNFALSQVAASVGRSEKKPTAVFLNGYVVQKSTDIYWTLFNHFSKARLSGESCPVDQCAALIEKRFRHGWGSSEVSLCVIVIDEVDKVVEKHPKALFKVIDWMSLPHARCKLITISNSMELAIDAKTRSRLDITKQLVFLPYGIAELKEIVLRRVRGITPKLFADAAINLLCHQTASHYGDGRRLLQSASAAICGVLINMDEGPSSAPSKDGIVTVKDVHGVVRQIFHDRFSEFTKGVKSPALFLAICLVAKETEDLFSRNDSECRIPLEKLLTRMRAFGSLYSGSTDTLTRGSFLNIMETLRQVSLIDISVGEDRIPLCAARKALYATDACASLQQPYQTVLDSCRLHDVFGKSIASKIIQQA